MKKSIIAMLLVLVMMLSLAACGETAAPAASSAPAESGTSEAPAESGTSEAPANVETKVLKCAFNQTITNPEAVTLQWIGEQLLEATEGRYTIEVYPDAQLGDQAQTLEQVVMGTLDMALVANAIVETYCPDFAILGTPYVYDSIEHQQRVFESGKLADLYAETEAQGFTVLSNYSLGARNLYTRDKAVVTPEDCKGMKIRVMGSDTCIKMMGLMNGGTDGIAMGQGDVYSAIQTGTLDGAENNIITYVDLVQYEVAPYYNLTGHLMIPDELCIANDVLASMSAEDQEALKRICNESIAYMFNLCAELRADYEAKAIEQGVTITEADVPAFQAACAPLIEEVAARNDMTAAVYEAILSER